MNLRVPMNHRYVLISPAGGINLTLTIVMLVLRLSEHIGRLFR